MTKKCGTDCLAPTGRKGSDRKGAFAFTGEAVLIEELGGGAGHNEMRNRLFNSDRQKRIRQNRRFLPLLAEPF
ncbi:MAG: hypothetical protein ACQEWW_01000 [Bacillota bacterium]